MAANINGDTALATLSTWRKNSNQYNLSNQHLSTLHHAWDILANIESVGTRDLIYCPGCPDLKSPPNFHMFILEKTKSVRNIILIRYSFLKSFKNYFPNSTICSGTPCRIQESIDISNRLVLFQLEAKSNYPGKRLVLNDLAQIITISLLRAVSDTAASQPVQQQPKDIGPAICFIQNNYNTPITLDDLAHQVNYSKYYFTKVFKRETGMSPFDYITSFRLEKAKELLTTTSATITEICLQCGFQNSSHFATVFKRSTGLCPTNYRQTQAPNNSNRK